MKTIILTIALLLAPTLANAASCGFPPYPPFGCTGKPVCICTGQQCEWIFTQCS